MARKDTRTEQDTIAQVRLPQPLQCKDLHACIGIALFSLARGDQPTRIPGEDGGWADTSVPLSPRAKQYFDKISNNPAYGFSNNDEIILHALAWLHDQPEPIRSCKIEEL